MSHWICISQDQYLYNRGQSAKSLQALIDCRPPIWEGWIKNVPVGVSFDLRISPKSAHVKGVFGASYDDALHKALRDLDTQEEEELRAMDISVLRDAYQIMISRRRRFMDDLKLVVGICRSTGRYTTLDVEDAGYDYLRDRWESLLS